MKTNNDQISTETDNTENIEIISTLIFKAISGKLINAQDKERE
ncbi:hypothetical protein [Cytobacillus kochii]|nr:hypothetical protein [Cytobacillus kochii]MDM5209828.1 hypothetical protein [Cytobacillus kochii]